MRPKAKAGEGKGIFSGIARVLPSNGLKGIVAVPGDKSISHRALIIGSIADGRTHITGFLSGSDTLATLNAMRAMGVIVDGPKNGKVTVHGVGIDGLQEPDDCINAENSGTTARVMAGLLSGQRFFSVITGDSTLRRRPMRRVIDPLRRMGANIRGRKDDSLLPIAIGGARLKAICYESPVASAQVKSSVLMAGLFAEGETIIREPEKSRDHTERMLRLFGAGIEEEGLAVKVRGGRGLKACKVNVPGDISSAAFLMVGALIAGDSGLTIKDVGINPTRTGILDILKKMGGRVEVRNKREGMGEPLGDIVVNGGGALNGIEISGAGLLPAIDEFPVICVAAAFAKGRTRITGAGELRVKESDRISAMAGCLNSLGVKAEELPDGIVIHGSGGAPLGGKTPVLVHTNGDHRVAMSLAIAGLKTNSGIEIHGAGSVDVSFPGFFDVLQGLRA